ncbi:hypothetical protein [Natrinema salsiterrestre]|uniref:Uncharacterized protein n=1 Tax=Natrinema salsiterrestre TaxID=2950540 RepID=A0A9Q4KYU6_9EURY|nr:hypothetical protein [Natrinema salsiterrestre]MDF9744202.1 hypothetical protein [Natrinema salsiterrestre]
MPLIVEETDTRTEHTENGTRREPQSSDDRDARTADQRRRIDVSDVHTTEIREYVRSNLETDAVSLEHRGGRTYLLIEE